MTATDVAVIFFNIILLLNMNNPWNQIKPFEVMMTDTIVLKGSRQSPTTSISTIVDCCIFPVEDVEPFSEVDIDSDLETVKIVALSCEYMPQVGDVAITEDDVEWKLTSVKKSLGQIDMTARSK